jgi:Na+-transporting methylmalonyl-CoA/oxaloacetate decarboxylase gamma subunit
MTIHEEKSAGYITLKEASERFGYAPDYIGQLIRKGKIEGKQVYANVAWMTTEEAMTDYVATLSSQTAEKRSGKSDTPSSRSFFSTFSLDRFMTALFTEKMTRIYVWGMRVLLVVLLIALVFVFYFLSIVIDRKLTKVAEFRVEGLQRVAQEQIFYESSSRLTYER